MSVLELFWGIVISVLDVFRCVKILFLSGGGRGARPRALLGARIQALLSLMGIRRSLFLGSGFEPKRAAKNLGVVSQNRTRIMFC